MGGVKRGGFTLVELLVVITIIGVLMALIIPAISGARERARIAQCANNMRELATAIQIQATAKDRFPYLTETVGTVGMNWVADALKSVRRDVYDQWATSGTAPSVEIELLLCPSDVRTASVVGELSYAINAGREDNGTGANADHRENGIAHKSITGVKVSLDFIAKNDGQANTILLGENVNASKWTLVDPTAIEKAASSLLWHADSAKQLKINVEATTAGEATDVKYARPSARHPQGANLAFTDGHVQFVSERIDYQVYGRLMTPHGAGAKEPGGSSPTTATWQSIPLNEGDF